MTDEVMNDFQIYHWPGNVRELENLIESAYIRTDSLYLDQTIFPSDLSYNQKSIQPNKSQNYIKTLSETRNEAIRQVETEYLYNLLSIHHGKIEATARGAGVSLRQIHKLLKKYNIKKEAFKVKAKK